MSRSRKSHQLHYKGQASAVCEQAGQSSALARCLLSKAGKPQLNIPRGVLPEFLIRANEVSNTGRTAEVEKLLNDQAVETICQMAEKDPSHANVLYLMLAIVFHKIKKLREAEKWYKKILETESHAMVYNELACIYQLIGHFSEALPYRKKAIELSPDVGIRSNYATDLIFTGEVKKGVELFRELLEEAPSNPIIHSNVLWYTHYLPDLDRRSLFDEHKRWGQIHTPISMAKVCHDNAPDPDRRLRVGYISPDFRKHSVAYNFEAFLAGRDRQAIEVYGYGNVAHPDEMTERLKKQFDHYRNVRGVDDKSTAGVIEEDKIDILVEIGGHTGDNRLGVLAYKPAPVQVDYGGVDTSGMLQIDYRFTDSLLDPGELQKYYVEESVYLPGGLFCYTPHNSAPAVGPLPAHGKGYITFGSFNNNPKINRHIMLLWAEILKEIDNSRFLMKFGGGNDPLVQEHFFSRFEQLGISRDRVEIHGWKLCRDHLNLYNQVDIGLDTYPYNGCVTTLEGFWMGVPTISLVGKNNLLSRAGLSMLSRVGLEFFAASTPDEYVAKACVFAQKLDALAKIRSSLRQRMAVSTLCDAKGYAKSVEAAYREMWHRWCRSKGVDVQAGAFQYPDEYTPLFSSELTQTAANTLEAI